MAENEVQNKDKTEKIKAWLKNPYNLVIFLVIAFVLIIRIYYFFLTLHQPLWWDESEYMAAAKTYAGMAKYQLISARLPGLSLFLSLFFKLGITSEPFLRFIVLLIPALIVLLLTFLLIKEMYPDKRIAIISVLILAVLWEHLFYSNRFQTENIALIFEMLSIYILFKSYVKKENSWFIKPKYSPIFIFLFMVLSVFFRAGNFIFVPAMFAIILVLNASLIFRKKNAVYVILAAVLLVSAAYYILSLPRTGLLMYYQPQFPMAWNSLSVFYGLYQSLSPSIPSVLFYVFLIGLAVILTSLFIYLPTLKSIKPDKENLAFKSDVFNILLILSVLSCFIFLIRPKGFEFRWFFSFITAVLAVTARGLVSFSDYLASFFKKKNLAILFIAIILVIGLYTQVARVDPLIRQKLDSYAQVRDSGLWIKENSNPEDVIFSGSVPQHSYYSERKVYGIGFNVDLDNETYLNEKIQELKPRYIVVSNFERVPSWMPEWTQQNQDRLSPVKAYFADSQSQQPILVIYQIKYDSVSSKDSIFAE